jgi:hypothetical protein
MSKLIPKFTESRKITAEEEKFIPPIIKTIINNSAVLLGGSFALRSTDIHGDYSNSKWAEYDFDLYATDFNYRIEKKMFKDNPNIFKKINKTPKEKSKDKEKMFLYSNLKIKDIAEYSFLDESKYKSFKIQLVNIGDHSDFGVLYDAIDLSFCSVLYCGLNKTFYFLKTTQLEIINRRGTFFPNKNEDMTGHLNMKSITRILKYTSRGFTITNIDPFTKKTRLLSRVSETLILNWLDHLFHDNIISFQNVLDGKFQITESIVNSVIPTILNYDNNSMYLTGFLLTALSKNIDIMTKYYDRFLHKFDINIPCYKRLIHYLSVNGLYTAFKLIFEYYMKNKQVIESDLISMMMNNVTMYNYINCALLICKHIPTIRVQIFEDRISKQWRILSIFESFLEIEDDKNKDETIMALIKQLPFLTTLSQDEIKECNICPICNTADVNVKIVVCKHFFCTNCLFGMFDILERNKKPLSCQVCRAVCK